MTIPLNALIVEDVEDDAKLLLRELRRGGYEPHYRRVDQAHSLDKALDENNWDIVFADYTMAGFSGTEALSMIRGRGFDMPFVFVSGTIGEDKAVEAMRSGAQDYILKDNLKRLLPVVERELTEARNRRQQRRAEKELNLLHSSIQHAAYASNMYSSLRTVLGTLYEITGWPMAQVWLPNADGSLLECSAVWYCRDKSLEPFRAISMRRALALGEDLPGRVWRDRQTVQLHDIASGESFWRADAVDFGADISAVAVPVLAGEELVAVLEFLTHTSNASDARAIEFVSTVALQLGGIIQRKRAEERLQYLAHYDDLTGLPNRVLFMDRLKQTLIEANRNGSLIGVMFLDLDRFKVINDSLGHRVGDLLLKAVSERIVKCVRKEDTVSRLAGDEFTLILRGISHVEHVVRVAQKILTSIEEPFTVDGLKVYTGASIGATVYPSDPSDADGLLRNADMAMYRAKEAGGNTCEFYDVDMTFKAQASLAMENTLRHALEHHEFDLHYQPIVDLSSRRISEVEALIRWRQPGSSSVILPDEFIPTAEETGLITAIGEWVLFAACRSIGERLPGSAANLRVAVNVSPRQFTSGRILETVTKVVKETGFDPSRLNLEITEGLFMRATDVVLKTMRKLGELGVRFSVDDFGTGFCSLSYLKRYPVSQVKIDKSFMREVPGKPNDSAIVRAIISMAHSMDIKVIAEGVETRRQIEFLRGLGCDAIQGYYFSHPVALDTIVQYVSEDKRLPLLRNRRRGG